jgi:hypothetical protein
MPTTPVSYHVYVRTDDTYEPVDTQAPPYDSLVDIDPLKQIDSNSVLFVQTETLHDYFVQLTKTTAFKQWLTSNQRTIDTARRTPSTYNDNTGKWDYGPIASLNYPILGLNQAPKNATVFLQISVG